MTKDKDSKGYTVEGTVDITKQRDLPNSDAAGGDNMTYQDNPWDKSDPQDGKPGRKK